MLVFKYCLFGDSDDDYCGLLVNKKQGWQVTTVVASTYENMTMTSDEDALENIEEPYNFYVCIMHAYISYSCVKYSFL